MIKYKTVKNAISYSTPIVAVEVERETEQSVWISGQRKAKRSDWDNYFDTWEEAKAHIVAYYTGRKRSQESTLEITLDKLQKAQALTREQCG